jgi:hypothetical protein
LIVLFTPLLLDCATCLWSQFAYFGVRLLWEARTAESDTVDGLKEAEEELSSEGSPTTAA